MIFSTFNEFKKNSKKKIFHKFMQLKIKQNYKQLKK